ncbi:EAL domain-containing protein [uncultured Methylobacterium sp.]|jgi:diguanylate cyclase (GGDEF)-like protein/PAS domain S-box-containing protein|uniref:putative bifunctional diguanylate cyclase/phosphodiesterase n=1 Tax=uncultured Methylobacterium sp. TaxID=157278 RepID=UPI002609DF08|nr:EAL domain-containing protein [uncultured Methylobacterium sp.]
MTAGLPPLPADPGPADPDLDTTFRTMIEGVTDYAIFTLREDGTIADWNAGAQRTKGFEAHEIVGRPFSVLYLPEDRDAGRPEELLAQAREAGRVETEGWRVRRDGSRFWAHVVLEAIRRDGVLIGFTKITRDITRQKHDGDRALGITRLLDLALSNISQGLCLFDGDQRLRLVNRRFSEIFGLSDHGTLIGCSLPEIWARMVAGGVPDGAGEADDAMLRRHRALIETGAAAPVVEVFPGGLSVSISHRRIVNGAFVTTFEDVTRQQAAEREIARLAHQDDLTGLANRSAFRTLMRRTCEAASAGADIALLLLDLDGFKGVNDALGHTIGDAVLQQVAERLRATLPDGFAARLGGDEFAVLLAGHGDRLAGAADGLVRRLGEPYDLPGAQVTHISASLGIATGIRNPDLLFSQADYALYSAKNAGKARWRLFSPEMEAARQDAASIERGLDRALARDQFVLHYQPITDLETGRVTSREALLRWHSPERGWTSPELFIPIAEQTGQIREIGAWVLARACQEAAAWPDEARVAVNVSPRQLGGGVLPDLVLSALLRSGLPVDRLELEITETTLLGGDAATLTDLRFLREMGVRIALDDFGVGFSSLAHVRTFPFDRIKIDGSFVRDAVQRPECRAVVGAIAALGRRLGVATVAEGVETAEQLALVREEGCSEVQGYLIGRPAPLSQDGLPDAAADLALPCRGAA